MMRELRTPSSLSPSHSVEAANPYLLAFLFGLFLSLVVLRFLVTSTILNTISSYSTEGGSALEKLHFTSYGLAATFIIAVLSFRIELSRWELTAVKALIQLIAVISALAGVMILSGRTTSAGYLVDAYVVACVFGMTMFVFRPAWRETVGSTLILVILASSAVGIGEFLLGVRLLPYPLQEQVFRPTGLTSHPLQLGLFAAAAISFVPLTRWPVLAKAMAIVLLLICTFAAGARLASLVASASTLALILTSAGSHLPGQKATEIRALVAIAVILAVPLVVVALVQMGFVGRFERGLFDDSAMTRVNVYDLFSLVEWREILFGTDIVKIERLAKDRLGIEYIESSIIVFVFQFGLIGALVFGIALVRTIVVLLKNADRRAILGTCAFFLIALSNNTLSSKEPEFLLIVLLVIAFHRR